MSSSISAGLERTIRDLVSRYPSAGAALVPALRLVQDEAGWISPAAERRLAELLGMTPIRVREVVTFYSMLTRRPLGRYHIQVCSNVSCYLAGGDRLSSYLQTKLGLAPGETTPDGKFTLTEVECLGGCDESPCLLINYERYGRLDTAKVDRLLEGLD
jgi:NADH-quinone oxidoreductase subunit E